MSQLSPTSTSKEGTAEDHSPTMGAVITHLDAWPMAIRCVEALRSWGPPLQMIHVVDDHSSTPPPRLPQDPRLTITINNARRGFAATLNRAIEETATDIVLVFDADAYPLCDFGSEVRDAFLREPRLGLLGFRTVDENGADTPSWSPEPGAFALIAGQRLDQALRSPGPQASDRLCLHAAAFAARRGALFAVGGADEDLGFLDVDLDLSIRVRQAGWLVRWDPRLTAFHRGGGTPMSTSWRVEQFHRSRFRLLQKHGRIRFPRLVRYLILARVAAEFVLLKFIGRLVIRDPSLRRERIDGRRRLASVVLNELPRE